MSDLGDLRNHPSYINRSTGARPAVITLRYVTYNLPATLIVEHDGAEVARATDLSPGDGNENAEALQGAELALTTLGYTADRYRMYLDDSLLVLRLYRDGVPPPSFRGKEVTP